MMDLKYKDMIEFIKEKLYNSIVDLTGDNEEICYGQIESVIELCSSMIETLAWNQAIKYKETTDK